MKTAARAPRRIVRVLRRVGVIALLLCGMIADGGVGLAVLQGAAAWVLALHLPAALLWAEGMSRLDGWSFAGALVRRPRRAETGDADADAAPRFHGRTVALSLIGLLLFPGFGTFGCTVAIALSSLRVMAHHKRATPPIEIVTDALPVGRERATDPLRDLAIEPLVDILRERENTQRHAAIRLLGRRCDRASVALLRGLLADPDPDIRSEASTTLFNFEMHLNRALNAAVARVAREPDAPDVHADLAATYRAFVGCGLLDGPSARLYLTRASTALDRATALAPDAARYWLALAAARRDLGDADAASQAVARARALSPDDAATHLLAMELAFGAQRWADLIAVSAARQGGERESAEVGELRDWWAALPAAQPSATGGGRGAIHMLAPVTDREEMA